MSVYITQCLCPARHCIIAHAREGEDVTPEAAREALAHVVDFLIAQKIIKSECGICGAPRARFHFEDARTRFETLAEAEPQMREVEEANARARAMLGGAARN